MLSRYSLLHKRAVMLAAETVEFSSGLAFSISSLDHFPMVSCNVLFWF